MNKNEVYIKKSDVMRLLKKHHKNGGTDVDGDWVEGAYSESLYDDIQELSPITPQEPCTDAISRQAVLDHIYGVNGLEGLELSNVFEKHYADFIKSLPPVTPQQTFEGMTNGEVIQALFPKIKVKPLVGVKGLLHVFFDKKEDNAFDEDWWDALYKGGAE